MRTLRSSTFRIDNGSRERDALTTFRLPSEAAIGLARAGRTVAGRLANLRFLNRITDANDHVMLHLSQSKLGLMRIDRKRFCA